MGIFSFFKKDKKKAQEQNQNLEEKKLTNEETAEQSKLDIVENDKATSSEIVAEAKNALEENTVEVKIEEKAEANVEAKAEIDADANTEAKPEVESKANTEAKAEIDADANTEAKTEVEAEEKPEEIQPVVEKKKEKLSFFARLKRTRDNLALGISALVRGRKIDDELYEELETALLTADVGVETTEKIIEKLRSESSLRALKDAEALKDNLKQILKDIVSPCAQELVVKKPASDLPFVILMVGVNGAGKTTTIGKLAQKFKAQGLSVMLAAGDTFRAAAVEQLKEWGKRTDTPVIAQPTGSDSASVIYDALESAKAHNADVLICDTAGRLQNKENLMRELVKIVRVMKKIDESVPHEVLLVLDAATGQNAVSQMKIFSEAVNVSGLCITKLDGTAKGGVVFCLADTFKIPVRFVGIGEKAEDLRKFDVDNFVDALFEADSQN